VDKHRVGTGFTWNGPVVGTKGGDNTVAIVDFSNSKGKHIGLYFFPPFAQVRLTAVKTVHLEQSPRSSHGRDSLPTPLYLAAAPPTDPIVVRLTVNTQLKRFLFVIGTSVVVEWHKPRKRNEPFEWRGVVEAAPDTSNAVMLRLSDGKKCCLPPGKGICIDRVFVNNARESK
jgi:hypothetical protein